MTRAIVVKRVGSPVVLAAGSALLSSMAAQAKRASDAAESAAAAALAAAGVGEYASTALGIAGTAIGETFWVDQGDGTGQVYRHDSGPVATALRPFIIDPTDSGAADLFAGGVPTTAALASPAGGGMMGLADGENAQQHSDRLRKFGTASFALGTANAEVDPTARGSWAFGQYDPSFKNIIGKNGVKPTTEPAWGARAAEANYVAGAAEVATIAGGYDNVNNGLACHIMSQHSMIYAGATHARIDGGSLHTIYGSIDYAGIQDGTSNVIENRCSYGQIVGSDQCRLKDNGSITASGFRGYIAASSQAVIGARNSAAIGCVGVTLNATYSTALNLEASTISAGNHLLLGGSNITGTGGSFSVCWGDDIQFNANRALMVGSGHRVNHDYAVATGQYCVPPFPGARTHGARARGNVPGNHMALDFQCSQETTDGSVVRLSVIGSSTWPVQPANTVVTGTFYVSGVKDDGTSGAWKIDFSSVMGASGAPALKGATVTEMYDDLTVTNPSIVMADPGIYRIQVVGLAATNIRWSARFVGQQVGFG